MAGGNSAAQQEEPQHQRPQPSGHKQKHPLAMCSQVSHGENEAAHDQIESRIVPQAADPSSDSRQRDPDKVHEGCHRKREMNSGACTEDQLG